MDQLVLPLLADVVPRGDGSFVLRPRVQSGSVETWLTPREAAQVLGFRGEEGRSSVYRLIDRGLLVSRRPSPRKILISASSVEAHVKASADAEFWNNNKPKGPQ